MNNKYTNKHTLGNTTLGNNIVIGFGVNSNIPNLPKPTNCNNNVKPIPVKQPDCNYNDIKIQLHQFSNVINHIQDKNNDILNTLLNINNRVTDLENNKSNNKDSVYIGQSAPDSDIYNIWINTSDSEQIYNYVTAALNNNNETIEIVDTVETLALNEDNESIVVYEVQENTTEEPEVINIGDSGEIIEL